MTPRTPAPRTTPAIPFRVHLLGIGPVLVAAESPVEARKLALQRHPGAAVLKIKQDRSDRPSERKSR